MTAGTLTVQSGQSGGDRLALAAAGAWTAEHAQALEPLVEAATRAKTPVRSVAVDAAKIDQLDSRIQARLEKAKEQRQAAEQQYRAKIRNEVAEFLESLTPRQLAQMDPADLEEFIDFVATND